MDRLWRGWVGNLVLQHALHPREEVDGIDKLWTTPEDPWQFEQEDSVFFEPRAPRGAGSFFVHRGRGISLPKKWEQIRNFSLVHLIEALVC